MDKPKNANSNVQENKKSEVSSIREKLQNIREGIKDIKSDNNKNSLNQKKESNEQKPSKENTYKKNFQKNKNKKKKDENLKNEEVLTPEVIVEENITKLGVKGIRPSSKIEKMYVIPLGGLEEIGKNMTVLQYKDEIIIVDAGGAFPDESLPGIDLVIQDFTFLENNKDKIKALLVTHGHEDHIGSIPYLYEKIGIDVPIYGGKLTLALIKSKFENYDKRKKMPKMKVVKGRSVVEAGKYFSVEFISVTHSITDCYSMAIKTPAGLVFHTGDFKIDLTPVDGDGVDFARLAEIGEEGVDLMLSDSTNSEIEGFTPSERTVGEALKQEFLKAEGRVIIATFASHMHRIQQIINIAKEIGRKIAIDGRSLVKVFEIAPTVGCLKIPEGLILPLSEIDKLDDDKILILCTGTQGEPMAALSRIAKKMHKFINIKQGDTVIISSTPIPGNEKAISSNINNLLKFDAEVVFKKIAGIHVSGHGSQEEQKLMLNLIRPRYFMPVHGEHRMLKAHKKTAIATGVDKDNVIITGNGAKVEVTKDKVQITGKVTSGDILVDGLGVGDIGQSVIRDRQQLSEDGVVIISYAIDKKNMKIISGPEIISKGFIYFKESEDLINEVLKLLKTKMDYDKSYSKNELISLKNNIKETAARFFYTKTKRNPVIIPIVTVI